MKSWKSLAVLMVLALVTACASSTPPATNPTAETAVPARGPLEGVWQLTEAVVTGANPRTTTQPGLVIFAKTHYSFVRVPSSGPRALFKTEDPTNEEKIAAYDSMNANTGTYEARGTTLTLRPVIARNPNFAAGGSQTYQFQIDGNTLTLTNKTTDLNLRIGDAIVTASPPVDETRLRLTRVE